MLNNWRTNQLQKRLWPTSCPLLSLSKSLHNPTTHPCPHHSTVFLLTTLSNITTGYLAHRSWPTMSSSTTEWADWWKELTQNPRSWENVLLAYRQLIVRLTFHFLLFLQLQTNEAISPNPIILSHLH
jgi:hypothetical protein